MVNMKFFGVNDILEMIPTPFPTPDKMNYAVRVKTSQPKFDVSGVGRRVFRQMAALTPTINVTNTYPAYGYGGLQTGQVALQPLMIPVNKNGGTS